MRSMDESRSIKPRRTHLQVAELMSEREIEEAEEKMEDESLNGNINFNNGEWQRYKMHLFAPRSVQKWNVRQGLYLEQNDHPGILQEIHSIKFEFMEWLQLAGNKIASIEVLPRLMAPNLTVLGLDDNNISSLKAIGKVLFPKLNTLSLRNNKFVEGNRLAQLNVSDWDSLDVGALNVEEVNKIKDLRLVFKLEAKQVSDIFLLGPDIMQKITRPISQKTNSPVGIHRFGKQTSS